MNNMIGSIQELVTLEDIENNEILFERKYGYLPFNISTWNPSLHFMNTYLLNKVFLSNSDYISYLYSYEINIDKMQQIKSKIGCSSNMDCLITNTGTAAITLVTSVLKELGVENILIVSPSYYAMLYNCLQKNMTLSELHMIHTKYGYILPQQQISDIIHKVNAIWITNPIYNTGMYYTPDDIEFLKSQLNKDIFLICDDCFSLNGHELIREFCNFKKFIGINDPLKQILVNGLKFATISFSKEFANLFEQWSDIVCGSLSYSTIQSIDFFLSDSFDSLLKSLDIHFKKSENDLNKLIKNFPRALLDSASIGHMKMCYFNDLPADLLQNTKILYKFMEETASSIIPGNRFHFSDATNFCFRINMGRECKEFWDALYNVLKYLSTL